MGRKHFWFTVIPLEPADEGTDRWAVEHGLVSMTPLRLDLTDRDGARERAPGQSSRRPSDGRDLMRTVSRSSDIPLTQAT